MTTSSSPDPSRAPTGEVDPRVALTHVMLSRDDNAPLLARAILFSWWRSRGLIVQVALMAVAAGVLWFVVHQPVTAAFVTAGLVTGPAVLAFRARRAAQAMAPAGFTLGLGLGDTHLAVRHAVATVVSPYASWASVTPHGEVVRLVSRKGTLLVVPAELVGADLPRLQALVAGATATVLDDATSAADLPLAYVCTTATRAMLTRAVVLLRLRRRATVAVLVVDLFIVAMVALTRGPRPWGLIVLTVLTNLALVALEVIVAWRGLGGSTRAGQVLRAEVRGDALVVADATGTVTLPFTGIATVTTSREAVILRSRITSLLVLPRDLLPEADLARMTGAVAYFRDRR